MQLEHSKFMEVYEDTKLIVETSVIDSWANGTGYFNGGEFAHIRGLALGSCAKGISSDGRKMIINRIPAGNVVIFERYTDGANGVLVWNGPTGMDNLFDRVGIIKSHLTYSPMGNALRDLGEFIPTNDFIEKHEMKGKATFIVSNELALKHGCRPRVAGVVAVKINDDNILIVANKAATMSHYFDMLMLHAIGAANNAALPVSRLLVEPEGYDILGDKFVKDNGYGEELVSYLEVLATLVETDKYSKILTSMTDDDKKSVIGRIDERIVALES
jgi:hypothetical protein